MAQYGVLQKQLTSTVHSMMKEGLAGMGSNDKGPISEYSTFNEDIVRYDETVKPIISFLASKLFSDGIVVERSGEIIIPDEVFETHMKLYWVPFLHRCLRFILARGYLVYYLYENKKKVMVPMVPDIESICVEISQDYKTGAAVITPSWRAKENKCALYVCNSQSPFGISVYDQSAPVDAVKGYLRQLYQINENSEVAAYHNSRPMMVVEHPQVKTGGDPGKGDQDNFDEELERRYMESIHAVGADDLFINRIQRISEMEKQTYVENNSKYATIGGWWLKARDRREKQPAKNLFYIPHGLKYSGGPLAKRERDQAEIMHITEHIYNAFGIPHSVFISTSAGKQTATGVDMHKTTLLNTLKTWWLLFHTILTDVYRIQYNIEQAPISIETYTGGLTVEELKKTDIVKKLGKQDPEAKSVENKLYSNKDSGLVKLYLKSQFIINTPEQVKALFDEGVISWHMFKQLRIESVGLPSMLCDDTVPEPIRKEAMTMEQMIKLKENMKADGAKK